MGVNCSLPDHASLQQLATRLSKLSELSDDQACQFFLSPETRERLSSEHYQAWRSGKEKNASAGNRRRMHSLVKLFESLECAEVAVSEWLSRPTEKERLTPFDLLRLGRFDEVEWLVSRMAPSPGVFTFTPRDEEPTHDLVFQEEKGWVEIESEEDDVAA
jgi:hypothetical protein